MSNTVALSILVSTILLILSTNYNNAAGSSFRKLINRFKRPVYAGEIKSIQKIIDAYSYNPNSAYVPLQKVDLETDYVHFTTKYQTLYMVYNPSFRKKVWVFTFLIEDLEAAGGSIIWEQSVKGGDYYPHLYGLRKIPIELIQKREYISSSD